ncbi:MAG: N-6 DNA methylase [Verrucomicrobiaceae bacterium]|nr:N-6 DNA methylase [Verrucomicrobiaceae bacterium]
MLFARFLAENELLLEPGGMAISLEEASELAAEEKMDLWAYAARCAQVMLPQVFRADDPVLAIELPREHRTAIERLVQDLPATVFTADDALGWVYQFWRADEKEAVNKAGDKINADTISAVTQLFTEHYMVEFLLHNTLGGWWAARRMKEDGAKQTFASEAEARSAFAVPGVEWTYLRFIQDEATGTFSLPSSSQFPGWPDRVRELRLLDPCCGSGHFLVALLPILVALLREQEKLTVQEAIHVVLADMLHGLELDARCSQLAAFNVAFAAWKLAGEVFTLPSLSIACCGIAPNADRNDWLNLAAKLTPGDPLAANRDLLGTSEQPALLDARLAAGLGRLYDLFSKAPDLGSLLNPASALNQSADLFQAQFESLAGLLTNALSREVSANAESQEQVVAAAGIAKAADMLSSKFHLVVTNVPYLGRGKQGEVLKRHIETHYPTGKADLATAFVLRCLEFCDHGGTTALVTPQNWLFLGSYKDMRESLLAKQTWNCVARLGHGAFETIGGQVVNVALLSISQTGPGATVVIAGLDVSSSKSADEKATSLRSHSSLKVVGQADQITNPDARIVIGEMDQSTPLGRYAKSTEGTSTGDNEAFLRKSWELREGATVQGWCCFQGAPSKNGTIDGHCDMIPWEDGKSAMCRSSGARIRGHTAWNKPGILIGRMNRLTVGPYAEALFDKSCIVLTPFDPSHLSAIYSFCASPQFEFAVRQLDQKMGVATTVAEKVPFDLAYWQRVAAEKYPNGLPKPHSDDPTQWLFYGHPNPAHAHGMINREGAVPEPSQSLHIALARLLGYRWPRQTGSSFPDCPALEADGLEPHADADGIVCLHEMKGEEAAAPRLQSLLAAAFGDAWSPALLERLLAAVGFAGKTLEDWLRDGFFKQHCDLFHQRPFLWHLWDGLPRGFSAIVNYHQLAGPNGLGRRTLEKLTYNVLGDWISRQQDGVRQGVGGADDRLAAALELKKRLEAILLGEPPHDLFIRWKPLHEQPLGWEPDINDGVRLNIRPFMANDLPATSRGQKGAGILRTKPNIKWEKDRGKEPESSRPQTDFPWFWSADGKTFTGDRLNDIHLPRAQKEAARKA